MLTTLKLRLYPTADQQIHMYKNAGVARFVYNHALELRENVYKSSGETVARFTINSHIQGLKPIMPWIKEAHSQVIQASLLNLDTAYKNFFKAPGVVGFPKFKSKRASTQSFQYPQGVKMDPELRKVFLPRIGWVKARGWRKLTGKIKTCTVSYNTAGEFYVSILLQNDINYVVQKRTASKIGLDLGVVTFATLNDGSVITLPTSLTKEHKKLKRKHKNLSAKKVGSSNRKKAKKKLAKQYKRIANIRKDFAHKASYRLSENQAVVVEDLNIKAMTQAAGNYRRDLNREILNQGWYQFLQFLDYKLARNGNHLIKVDPRFTSQQCSRCGAIDKRSRRSQSVYKCTSCGYTLNADLNAAVNILGRA